MPAIVIVIADLYLAHDAALAEPAGRGALPGIESAARFGERESLAQGWRSWLARSVGRADLAAVAPARIAAAGAGAAQRASDTSWIATPLHLRASRTRSHLEHRGILRLPPEELAALVAAFRDSFVSSGFELIALPSGEFLLETPGVEAVPTTEPGRWAGGDVAEVLPRGRSAAQLRRFLSETEMWLHGLVLNEARARRGELAVTTLWPWGAEGQTMPTGGRAATRAPPAPPAFGSESFLRGLWQIVSGVCGPLPEKLDDAAAGARGSGAVLVAEMAQELQRDARATPADALARLDARFVSPALEALRRGQVDGVTVIANDLRLHVQRRSHLRLWRRARAGLGSFA